MQQLGSQAGFKAANNSSVLKMVSYVIFYILFFNPHLFYKICGLLSQKPGLN